MIPGYIPGMSDERSMEKHMEKQMGCMAGFRQLFDRHQLLAGKRLPSAKRLPASNTTVDCPSTLEKTTAANKKAPRELEPQAKQRNQHKPTASMEILMPALGEEVRELNGSPSPELQSAARSEDVPPAEAPARMSLPLPLFEFKDGLRPLWKLREAPRLSLDSRAVVDGKGSVHPREIRTSAPIFAASNRDMSPRTAASEDEGELQRRSPSVVARLMGLDALPDSARESPRNAELRRSASESRVSRDLMQNRLLDGGSAFQYTPQPPQPQKALSAAAAASVNAIQDNAFSEERARGAAISDAAKHRSRGTRGEPPRETASSPWSMKKSYFDSQDFFPEPKRTGSLYGEIEKRLKMRGIDEPAKDLETLKQILEALQLKGLLHLKRSEEHITGGRNIVFDRQFAADAPADVMRSALSPIAAYRNARHQNEPPMPSSRIRRSLSPESLPPVSPRPDRLPVDRNSPIGRRGRQLRATDPDGGAARSPSSLARRKASSEGQRKSKDGCNRRNASGGSPRNGLRKCGPESPATRSPRQRKPMAEMSPREGVSVLTEDESSSISESSLSTCSQIEYELQRVKTEEYKEGRSLLERCDKLLHSIAEITAAEQQPSPVSVLDSSLYKDDSSPSPVMKRCIDFKAYQSTETKDDWSPAISPVRSIKLEKDSDNLDFLYVSEILSLKAHNWEENSDLFAFLEKKHQSRSKSYPCYTVSGLHRRLVFDTVTEIFNRKQQLSPWEAFVRSRSVASLVAVDQTNLLRQIWSELERIQEKPSSVVCEEDVICGVIARDMAGTGGLTDGWSGRSLEISEVVLDIERLVFKDLVGDAIQDLACCGGECSSISSAAPRRKLAF